ncbi:MAG: hypothetical protein C3F07_05460 [Anaerolineales bacterium]|nr:redoxin domain-containing protein [Anaerolineae bacterium]PWB75826.1 MAG: hypothetical protein C3F07_05460 [Anaerolineales bacterium]
MILLSACGSQAPEPEATAAPDFTLPNATGEEVSLSDYGGRNVLLFFHMAVG